MHSECWIGLRILATDLHIGLARNIHDGAEINPEGKSVNSPSQHQSCIRTRGGRC